MHNYFNCTRFRKLIALLLQTNKRLVLYYSVAVAILLAFVYALFLLNIEEFGMPGDNDTAQYAVFYSGILLAVTFASSMSFTHIHKKAMATEYYLIPVSICEKFWSRIVVYFLLPTFIFIAVFFLITSIYLFFYNQIAPHHKELIELYQDNHWKWHASTWVNPFYIKNSYYGNHFLPMALLLFVAINSLYILFSTLLKRYHYIQANLYLNIYFIALFTILAKLAKQYDTDTISFNGFFVKNLAHSDQFAYVAGAEYWFVYGIPIGITIGALTTAYYRFKNKQI